MDSPAPKDGKDSNLGFGIPDRPENGLYDFGFRLAAQYAFMRFDTAAFCAADIFDRLRRGRIVPSSTASGIAGLTAEP
jgi:hypothetical protein